MCMWLCVKICLWSVSTRFLFLLMINISSLTPPHTSPSMFSQRMPVEAVSCQGRQRAQLLHLAGTPHTSTFFLFPFHTGNDPHGAQWGFFFSFTKVLIHGSLASCWIRSDSQRCFSTLCQCQNAIVVLKQGIIAPERNCSQKNAVGFLHVKHSVGEAGGSEGYGQSQGTALSLLSPLQRCSRLTTCPLQSHTDTHRHMHKHTLPLPTIKNHYHTSTYK